ncbi:glutathione S-transferase family protein [Rhizobium sp. ZPR3]|uniref:glutathione transferase n=2 Tax=unclassified Rhizobium TaxID=2613769 RepID=A0AAU7SLS6_9HYPH
MMSKPRLFGADYSVYVRICRLALLEKNVDYDLVPVDIFASESASATYLERQPFGKIPSFEHDDFRLYETGAIARYVDDAFPGSALQPAEPRKRARMNQIISIADAYVYPYLVWGMYVELAAKPARGEQPDESRVALSRAKAAICLKALSELLGTGLWLAGDDLTLADLYVAPMLDYFLMLPEGRKTLVEIPNLWEWQQRMGYRESFRKTRAIT